MRRLAIAAVAGLAGAVSLMMLFPRLDPSASSGLTLDRKHAIEAVRALSLRYGVDTTGWRAVMSEVPTDMYRAYQARYPGDPAFRMFGPVRLNVALIAPHGASSVEAVLVGDGRPLEWKRSPGGNQPPVDQVLHDFLGTNQLQFRSTGSGDVAEVKQQTWEWSAGEQYPMRATLVVRDAAKGTSIRLAPVFNASFTSEFRRSQKYVFGTVAKSAEGAVWGAALCFCLWSLLRRRIQWRVPLLLLGVQLVWAACSFFGGRSYQDVVQARLSSTNPWYALGFLAARTSVSGWSFLWLFVFAAVALAVRKASDRDRWYGFDLLGQGIVANRVVGASVSVGLLSGIAIAAIPYWIARITSAAMEIRAMDAVASPASLTDVVQLSALVPGLALFGFLFPTLRRIRMRSVYWVVFGTLGILVAAVIAPFRAFVPGLLTGILFFGAYLLLYLQQDLLAVLAAMVSARAILVPAVLLSQRVSSLRDAGIEMLAVGIAIIGAAVYWTVRGREPDAEQELFPAAAMPGDGEAETKSDRERLQAEFQVARKAQQDVLPAIPPVVAGYSLAGWCEPAQQVGGDLYDYFPLPDGRLGIAVADVSGKGVPAALYMMVTKGLLSAVSRDSSQLAYILEQVNLHLYRACRKKVFVTLAAVVLDSASRRLEYGRAGHNPVVWRRSRRGETTLVKPPGLGLGMTPGERFSRALKIEELELEPEDAIVLYSDGVTEAVNHEMEQFGEERLLESVARTDGRAAEESRDAILRDLAEFMGTTPPRDDITLVVIRAA